MLHLRYGEVKGGLQMINLHELLGIKVEDFCNYKVHFAIFVNEMGSLQNACNFYYIVV